MKKHFAIKEFSEITGVEISKLRYWDEIGLFSPVLRNPENSYRYYSLTQVTALNFVTVLSDLNFPLKTIGELRSERDPETIMKLMEKQEHVMDMEMNNLRKRYSILHARRELITYGAKIDPKQVFVKWRDDKQIILWPRNEYEGSETFIDPLASYINQTTKSNIDLSYPVGGYYDDFKAFQSDSKRPNHFFSIDPTGHQTREAGEYLIGFAIGDYGEIGDLPDRMTSYAKKNSIATSGPVYLMYLYDEICVEDPDQFVAQACIAVSKSKRK